MVHQHAGRIVPVLFVLLTAVAFLFSPTHAFAEIVFGSQMIVTDTADGSSTAVAADIDGDGDLDLLASSMWDNKVMWYGNVDGAGTFGGAHVISQTSQEAMSVCAADLDGDGDLDVACASRADNTVAWFENTDGNGTFGAEQVINGAQNGVCRVLAADLDGDGDQDIICVAYNGNRIGWFENDGTGTFGPIQTITTASLSPTCVAVSDQDGDGDLDILSTSNDDGDVAWYENVDGAGTFGEQQLILTHYQARCITTADMDGDGDRDPIYAAGWGDRIAWYPNLDGFGTTGYSYTIDEDQVNPQGLTVTDFDLDGDNDIAAVSFNDDMVCVYENLGGGTSFTTHVLSTSADGGIFISHGDFDGDNDADLIVVSRYDDTIRWYRNNSAIPAGYLSLLPDVYAIPANGGPLTYTGQFSYNITPARQLSYWAEVELASGQVIGPVIQLQFTAIPGMNISRSLEHVVPAGLPAGTHTYIGHVGIYPNAFLTDSFEFIK